jgi:hypothetical protein
MLPPVADKAPEILRSEAYLDVRRNDACATKRFSAQATKDEGNPPWRTDERFSAAC